MLRYGAFLAEAFFFIKSRPLFIKSAFLDVFYVKTSLFIIKGPTPGLFIDNLDKTYTETTMSVPIIRM